MIKRDIKLGVRTSLPESQQFLLQTHPRTVWPEKTVLLQSAKTWLQVHSYFRSQANLIDTQLKSILNQEADVDEQLPVYCATITEMLSHLEMHHKIEDHHYFPKFQRSEPKLREGFEIIDADHDIIHQSIHDLSERSNTFLRHASKPINNTSNMDSALNTLNTVFQNFKKNVLQHLNDEEELVIPLIIEKQWH